MTKFKTCCSAPKGEACTIRNSMRFCWSPQCWHTRRCVYAHVSGWVRTCRFTAGYERWNLDIGATIDQCSPDLSQLCRLVPIALCPCYSLALTLAHRSLLALESLRNGIACQIRPQSFLVNCVEFSLLLLANNSAFISSFRADYLQKLCGVFPEGSVYIEHTAGWCLRVQKAARIPARMGS